MAAARRAAIFPSRARRGAAAELRVLRRQPAVRRLQRVVQSACAGLPGTARRLGRLPDRGAVCGHASERHAVAPRRRSSADREPSAHVGQHLRFSGASRMTRRIVLALLIGFGVPGSTGFGVLGSVLWVLDSRAGIQNPEPLSLRIGIARPGSGYAVQTMPLETYVARVVAGEAARNSQPAALEALAITVRTFALANRGRHRADNFDLCDQTHCQVVRAATAATERAAHATAGRVLVRNGAPASIFYTASCGGRTEIPSAVWPGAEDPPFLPSRDDDACQGAPTWSAELRDADLVRALGAAGFHGDRLRDMHIVSRSSSGRVARIRV